jgi:hypothetical protein
MTNKKKNTDVAGTEKPEGTASPDAKRRPIKTIRVDDCSASIWARTTMIQGESRTFLSITLERSYKDRDGTWRYVKSFDPDSLGKVVSLCQQTSEYISELKRGGDQSEQDAR